MINIIIGSIIRSEINLHSRNRAVKLHPRKLGRDIRIWANRGRVQRFGRIIEPIVRNTMTISKDQVPGHTRISGKVRDPVNHGLGYRELSEMATLDN